MLVNDKSNNNDDDDDNNCLGFLIIWKLHFFCTLASLYINCVLVAMFDFKKHLVWAKTRLGTKLIWLKDYIVVERTL